MSNVQNLRTPGPTPVPPEVVAAMQRPMINHRSDEFRTLHLGMIQKLREILRTEQDVFALSGSGSIGWEAALANTLSPGDPVLSFVVGEFGARFARVAELFGLDVRRVELEPGEAAGPELVAEHLSKNPDVRAVLYTHNETATSVVNPLEAVAEVVRDHDSLLIVDAVSSAGAVTIDTDRLGVDILLSGSQKGWMCPPGVSIVTVSERALNAGKTARLPRWYLDFEMWHDHIKTGDTPTTASVALYYALDAACDLILQEGMGARTDRHKRAADETRRLLSGGGFELLAEDARIASPTVTAARPPHGVGVKELVKTVRERYDIEVAVGQGSLSNEIIRIGHLGWFTHEDITRATEAVVACASAIAE